MKKKLAIIGASYLQLPLVQKAKKMDLYSICFAWEKGAVCKVYCDKYYPISITEKEEIFDVCEKEKIDGIISIASDLALLTVNYIATKLNLKGNSIASSYLSTNKYLMRNAFKKKAIQIPEYLIINNLDEKRTDYPLRFPLIVKPVDRSGSRGITCVNNPGELRKAIDYALEQSFVKEVIIEEFIEGKEISVEAISWQGSHHILAYTDKVTSGYPHFVELEHHQPSQIVNAKNTRLIDEIVIQGLNALNIQNGASHTELIITEKSEIFIIEIGARMGGDFIGSDLVMLSTGYDFLEGVINISLGIFEEPILDNNKSAGVYFLCKETEYLLALTENYKNNIEIIRAEIIDEKLHNVKCSADRSGYLIYQSENPLIV